MTPADLKAWVCEFVTNGELHKDGPKERTINLCYRGHLDLGSVAELGEYVLKRKEKGMRTTYKMCQEHLNSTERIHPLLDIDSVPKQFVESMHFVEA